MADLIKILSIDGGGIRGIIPARILAHIEEQTGRPISALFDLISGTSTGGILTLGMVKPDDQGAPEHSAEAILRLYEEEGPAIFSTSFGHRLRNLGSLIGPKYPVTPLEEVLQRYFGDSRLSQALTGVLITSYDIERRRPHFFKTRHAQDPKRKGRDDYLMRDIARATSAAPTYFSPFQLEVEGMTEYLALVDGGVYANNPAMCALAEMRRFQPDADILVVSLGTGQLTERLPYSQARRWGLARWARPVLDVVFDGVSDTVDYQLLQLLPGTESGEARFYRLQTALGKDSQALDNVSQENLRFLKLQAEDLIEAQSARLDKLCQQLTAGHEA